MKKDWFEELPIRRLELIDGKFIAGLNLEGSRRLFKVMCHTWGGRPLLALTADVEIWIEALNEAYALQLQNGQSVSDSKAEKLGEITKLQPNLSSDFHAFLSAGEFSRTLFLGNFESFGRDFVCRLAQDALTPSWSMVAGKSKARLFNSFLDGAPKLVAEFVRNDWDLRKHLDLYFENGVSELWLFNVDSGLIELFESGFDGFNLVESKDSGILKSSGDLAIEIEATKHWNSKAYGQKAFIMKNECKSRRRRILEESEDRWDAIEFKPLIELTPSRITFAEFIAWTGEAKFEGFGEGLVIGSPEGSRNVLGQLLMTFGLVEAVKLMPPAFWIEAVNARIIELQMQDLLRTRMWTQAETAKKILCEDFGYERITIAGDLIRNEPLGFWSEVSLVIHTDEKSNNYYEIYQTLREKMPENRISFYFEDQIPLAIRNSLADIKTGIYSL